MLGKWLIGPNWFGAWDPADLLSAPRWPGAAKFPLPGSGAIGGCFSAVLQAAGGLLMISDKGCLHLKHLRRPPHPNCTRPAPSSSQHSRYPASAARHAASLMLNRLASLFLSSSCATDAFQVVAIAYSAAVLPPPRDLKACVVDANLQLALGDQLARLQATQEVRVEPRTGTQFPLHLYFHDLGKDADDLAPHCQVLVGVGVRSKTIVKFKSIDIYAFGLYVHPEHLRAQLGDKYWNVPPEELKFCPEFYEDLLRHEVDMTVRMVVHYKGLKMHMVRSAFESSLKNRLRKIKGVPDDNGLRAFCSYLSEDVAIFRGTTIDVQWQPGGQLRTRIEGRPVGTIVSKHLCRAFFDLYIGDPPVSPSAKTEIGENFARILWRGS